MKNVQLAGVRAGDRLEAANAFELTVVRALVIERGTVNDLHRTPSSECVAGQPHFTITAAPDPADQLVVGNDRWLGETCGHWFGSRRQGAAQVVQQFVAGLGVGIHRSWRLARVCQRLSGGSNAGSCFNSRSASRSKARRKA